MGLSGQRHTLAALPPGKRSFLPLCKTLGGRAICADIKEDNEFKSFGQTGRWIKSSSCWTTPDPTPVCTQGRPLQQWGGLFSLIFPTAPILASSDFHLFSLLKGALGQCHFADDDELKHSVTEELRHFSRVLWDQHTASHAKVEKLC
jgi:hypothetical protein